MFSFHDFESKISNKFWKHIKKNTYVAWIDFPENKSKFLKEVYLELKNGTYTPLPPRDYVVSNKHNSVARIVPSLTLKDYCVYYFCVASLEEYLAKDRIEGTFGGFKLGGEIREKENLETHQFEEVPFSTSPFTYNPLAWVAAWRDFQKKAYLLSREKEYSYYLKYDIANFYNTINLTLLERKIRLACPKEKSDVIEILFFFLKYWNKKFLQYAEQTVSIPQDEVGDCSRILANFYLQDYDKYLYDLCCKKNCRYLRYADDQIIMSDNSETAEAILFEASKELFKIGLNINSSKVDRFTSIAQWDYYWCFEIFDLLGEKDNVSNLELAIKRLFQLSKNKCRYESVLSRLLNCDINNVAFDLKISLLSKVISDEYIANATSRTLLRIYNLLDDSSKTEFINKLELLSEKTIFNSYHYNLLRAKNEGLPIGFDESIYKRIDELKL